VDDAPVELVAAFTALEHQSGCSLPNDVIDHHDEES